VFIYFTRASLHTCDVIIQLLDDIEYWFRGVIVVEKFQQLIDTLFNIINMAWKQIRIQLTYITI